MKIKWLLSRLVLLLLLSACSTVKIAPPSPATTAAQTPLRQRIKSISSYMVYYGKGRPDDLARYGLAIIQPDTLTEAELASLKAHGTLVVAYLSVGEAEPDRPWFTDGRVDPKWLLGKNENWGSFFVDAGQPGWRKLMLNLTGEYIKMGFDGVFLDTVDTVDAFPKTEDGMIALIQGLRDAYPDALLIQNRGFSVVEQVAPALDALMFEDLSTSYDFVKKEYLYSRNDQEAGEMLNLQYRTGLRILALDYAPPDNPGMAYQAVKLARDYGFIPAVSVINLDDIPDYGLDKGGPADLRVSAVWADGDPDNVQLYARIDNVGLASAKQVEMTMKVDGQPIATRARDFQPGDASLWEVNWTGAKDGASVEVAVNFQDPTPGDNFRTWTFTLAALPIEPLLPFDQQRHRPATNGPDLTAARLTQPPKIDGDLSDWKGLPCTAVDQREQVSYGDPAQWTGPQDLSGSVCYAWDDSNLYVGFTVRDDVIVQRFTGSSLWQGDHVELWFDTQLQLDFDNAQNSDDDFQVGVSPGDFGNVPPDIYVWTPADAQSAYRNLVEYAVVRTADGYAGELKLPARLLKGLRLVKGNTIGVTFDPSDTDTPGGSDQELMMSTAPKSSGQWGNPTLWNNLTLTDNQK